VLIYHSYSVAPSFSLEGKEKPFPLIVCIQALLIYAADDLWLAGTLSSSYALVRGKSCLDLHHSSAT